MPNLSKRPRVTCQCVDPGCPAHLGLVSYSPASPAPTMPNKEASMSGYTDCTCRDCFDISMGGLCGLCEQAGCEEQNGECERDDAYGVSNGH